MHSQQFLYTGSDKKYSDLDGVEHDDLDSTPDVTVSFNFNSDLSGEVWIDVLKESKTEPSGFETLASCKVPGWMLLEFVGNYIGDEIIGKIEQTGGREILNWLVP